MQVAESIGRILNKSNKKRIYLFAEKHNFQIFSLLKVNEMLSPVMTSENVKSCGCDRHRTVVRGGMCIICEHGTISRAGTNMVRTENYRY